MNQSEAAVIIATLVIVCGLAALIVRNTSSEEYEVAHIARLEGQLTEAKMIRDARIARQEKAGKS